MTPDLTAHQLSRRGYSENRQGYSGDPTPSPEDREVTKQWIATGKLLEVELVDHIIIGSNHRFVSLYVIYNPKD